MRDTFDKNWFMAIRYNENAHLNIVCFPYGGGGSCAFWSWKRLSLNANIWALKLPGRENRIAERPIISAVELVDHIIEAFPTTFTTPFIFYGHSMGAGLAFQTIVELKKRKKQLPMLLIASGREPPHCKPLNPVSHLDDAALIQYMQKLGGITNEIPKNDDFLKQYLPKIRADYQLNSTILQKKPEPLPIFIFIANGQNDPVVRAEILNEWAKYTKYSLNSLTLPGGHFFMDDYFDIFILEVEKQIFTCLQKL